VFAVLLRAIEWKIWMCEAGFQTSDLDVLGGEIETRLKKSDYDSD